MNIQQCVTSQKDLNVSSASSKLPSANWRMAVAAYTAATNMGLEFIGSLSCERLIIRLRLDSSFRNALSVARILFLTS